MFFRRLLLLWRALFVLLLAGFLNSTAWAHGAFDHATRVWVLGDRIEVTVTMGLEAGRFFLNDGPEAALKSGSMQVAYPLPKSSAERIFQIDATKTVLQPEKSVVRSDGLEFNFELTYPLPTAARLQLRAVYLGQLQNVGKGSLAVADESGAILASKLLSRGDEVLELDLPRAAITNVIVEPVTQPVTTAVVSATQDPSSKSAPLKPSFGEFLILGIQHILTGFDHLLFLCALLIGVRKIGAMFAVITGFTIAHSITLALAAMNIVVISPRIIEPLIAVSIVVVGIENFVRRDVARDRYWLAAGFGLIHGFGFAGALREAGLGSGKAIIAPLFSFNLGVEIGQVAVAAVVVPLLLALRRQPTFVRFGAPALSSLVIVTSGYWLVERTFFFR